MRLSQKFCYASGAVLTAGMVGGAAILDFASENRAARQVEALNVPMMERFESCRKNSCSTPLSALNPCLENKAAAMTAGINTVMDQRSTDKKVYRGTMGFGAAYFTFLLLLARRSQPSAKPPQPR